VELAAGQASLVALIASPAVRRDSTRRTNMALRKTKWKKAGHCPAFSFQVIPSQPLLVIG
jgi:hypothetical protein